jgi:hypothetical protein
MIPSLLLIRVNIQAARKVLYKTAGRLKEFQYLPGLLPKVMILTSMLAGCLHEITLQFQRHSIKRLDHE